MNLPHINEVFVDDKGVKMYVVSVDTCIGLAYAPGGTAAVRCARDDFRIYWKPVVYHKKRHPWRNQNLRRREL